MRKVLLVLTVAYVVALPLLAGQLADLASHGFFTTTWILIGVAVWLWIILVVILILLGWRHVRE